MFFFSKKSALLIILTSIFLCSNTRAEVQSIWITLFNPHDIFDETVIAFTEDATDSFDIQFDSPKIRDSSEVYIYSLVGAGTYMVQAFPLISNDKTIILGMDAAVPGMHLLRLSNVENLDESIAIILEDTYNGTSVNLRKDPDYWFNASTSIDMQRFRIHLNPAISITTVDGKCDGTPSMLQMSQLGSYIWDYKIKNENDVVIDTGTSWNGMRSLLEVPTGTYSISFIDPFGYSVVKGTSLLDKEAVVAQFQVSDSIVSANTPVYFFDYSIGASSYTWDFGDGNILSGTPYTLNVFDQPGTYEVKFTATNSECNDTSEKIIEVLDNTTGINSSGDDSPRIYSYGRDAFIDFPLHSGIAHVEIYNTLGQVTCNKEMDAFGKQKISLAEGCSFCIIKVTLSNGKHFDRKVFLQ